MNSVAVIAFIPDSDNGITQSNVIQDLGFSGYGSLVAVYEYVQGSPYGNIEAAQQIFDVHQFPTILVGAVEGTQEQNQFNIDKFYPVERFEMPVPEQELKAAIDRVAQAEIDSKQGKGGKGFIDLGQDSKNGGKLGLNPFFGLFGGMVPWWLVLAGGFVLYRTIKD